MKKSDIYQFSMLSVIDDPKISTATKLLIIEQLMADKHLAEFSENKEGQKKSEEW